MSKNYPNCLKNKKKKCLFLYLQAADDDDVVKGMLLQRCHLQQIHDQDVSYHVSNRIQKIGDFSKPQIIYIQSVRQYNTKRWDKIQKTKTKNKKLKNKNEK